MKTLAWIAFSSLFVLGAATTLLESNFNSGPDGWITMGQNVTVRVTHSSADMRDNQPTLAFDYEIGQRKFASVLLPVRPNSLHGFGQIHFWVKTEFPTSLGITLGEKGGGNYTAIAWSPGSAWQEVRIGPRDFSLGDKPGDPPDPTGKLDVDRVQAIAVADLAQLFGAASRNPASPFAFPDHSGKHTLLISGFEVLGRTPAPQDDLAIDKFDAPQLSWLSLGGAVFHLDTSRQNTPGPALEVDYTRAERALVAFVRNLPPDIPPNITHISFDLSSEEPAQLIFTLQERGNGHGDGPRYSTVVEVNGKNKPDHRDLALSAFHLDPNGPPDPSGALNIARAKSLTIADISAAVNGDTGTNRFWISNLRFIVLN